MKYDDRAVGRLMAARGWNDSRTADAAKLERQTIALLRRRVTVPNARTLAKLATAFGVDANAFFINGTAR